MMKKITLMASAAIMLFSMSVMAQITMPQPSPLGKIEQRVGLTDVKVEYSRPSKKGRVIFGDLVPFDQMWRTGANGSTKISFSTDVNVNGTLVPAGQYALVTIPGAAEWTIILNKDITIVGSDGYDQTKDQLRFTARPASLSTEIETFTIGFTNVTTTSSNVELSWDKTAVNFAITTEVDALVMADIKAKLSENPNLYHQAASYYYDNKKDLAQALVWSTKACELRKEAFWMTHLKAKIQFELKDYKGALASAETSLAVATAAENDFGYKANNEKLIKEIKAASGKK